MIDPRIYTDVDGRYIGGDKRYMNRMVHLSNVPYLVVGMFSVASSLYKR